MNAIPPEFRVTMISPVVTRELFSHQSGLRPGQVRGQASVKNLPTIKVGHHSMINLAKLAWDGFVHDGLLFVPCPTMTAKEFSKACGLNEGQVDTQLDKPETGLPRCNIGRLKMVDVAEFYRRCLAGSKEA